MSGVRVYHWGERPICRRLVRCGTLPGCCPMESSLQARVFLVGCSRSGTTVVQRCLNAHPAIASFPETNFLGRLVGGWTGRLHARCNHVRPRRRDRALHHLAEVLDRPELADGPQSSRFADIVGALTNALDAIATGRGAQVWVEKTPKHFRYVDLLERHVPAVRFLHLVRDGRDVVASLVDRASRHPQFANRGDARAAARLWNEAVRAAWQVRGRQGHRFLSYEDFIAQPERELQGICDWLGLDYSVAMLAQSDASAIVTSGESWKSGAGEPIAAPRSRFETVFTAREQRAVTRMLDWGHYRALFPEAPRRAP